ncbi:MAG: transketolase family protein [Candidatus Diapherotrites archaeon]|nr:transketolase family protein [Candidatus Diapherotrites archaeon]
MKLSEKLFSGIEMLPSRDGYGHGLVALGERNPNVVVLGADLTASVRADWFAKRFPGRFLEVGIAEQNMVGIAAGLSLVGKIPFVATYGVFSTGRAWDQLRVSVCYPSLNVKVASAHGGISVGADGATHQALEDLAVTRTLPNMNVVVPADAVEGKKATVSAGEMAGPFVLRFGREKVPVVTTEETPFRVGRAETFCFGDEVSIVACGAMVYEALVAARQLRAEGIDSRVINLHTIKPIDEKTLVSAARETGAVVCAEEHQIMGGMGSAVCEVLARHCPVPVELVGVLDRFGESGEPNELMEKFGLTSREIVNAVKKVLVRKGGQK